MEHLAPHRVVVARAGRRGAIDARLVRGGAGGDRGLRGGLGAECSVVCIHRGAGRRHRDGGEPARERVGLALVRLVGCGDRTLAVRDRAARVLGHMHDFVRDQRAARGGGRIVRAAREEDVLAGGERARAERGGQARGKVVRVNADARQVHTELGGEFGRERGGERGSAVRLTQHRPHRRSVDRGLGLGLARDSHRAWDVWPDEHPERRARHTGRAAAEQRAQPRIRHVEAGVHRGERARGGRGVRDLRGGARRGVEPSHTARRAVAARDARIGLVGQFDPDPGHAADRQARRTREHEKARTGGVVSRGLRARAVPQRARCVGVESVACAKLDRIEAIGIGGAIAPRWCIQRVIAPPRGQRTAHPARPANSCSPCALLAPSPLLPADLQAGRGYTGSRPRVPRGRADSISLPPTSPHREHATGELIHM